MIKLVLLASLIVMALIVVTQQAQAESEKALIDRLTNGINSMRKEMNETGLGKIARDVKQCREETGNNTQCIIDAYGWKNQTEIENGLKALMDCDLHKVSHCVSGFDKK